MGGMLLWAFSLLLLQHIYAEDKLGENVALKKPVIGSGSWAECLTDGKIWGSTFAPSATLYPFFGVDLEAIYELDVIQVFAQYQSTFGNSGFNHPFNVSTYGGDLINPCDLHNAQWDLVATNLEFKTQGEMIELKPKQKQVQYILIWFDNPNNTYITPMVMSEIKAYGRKIKDTIPQIPEEDEVPPNHYTETRRTICAKQEVILVQQSYGTWVPDYDQMDVPMGWYGKSVTVMAFQRGKGRVVGIMGTKFIPELLNSPKYEGLRNGCRAWLANNSTDAKLVKISEPYVPGDMLIITRDDKFDAKKLAQAILAGENSAVIGYISQNTTDDATALIKELNIGFESHDQYYADRVVHVGRLVNKNDYVDLAHRIDRYKSWSVMKNERFRSELEPLWHPKRIQDKLAEVLKQYMPLMTYLAPCEIRAYHRKSEHGIAILNFNLLMNNQKKEKDNFLLPGVARHPGEVDKRLKPEKMTVKWISKYVNLFYGTNMYAKAGELVRYRVLETTAKLPTYHFVRVNGQTDQLDGKGSMIRWPRMSYYQLLSMNGTFASPHGGPIYLKLEPNINVTVEFENVYRMPYVYLRDPKSVEAFEKSKPENEGIPSVMIIGDMMTSQLNRRSFVNRKTVDVLKTARFMDDCIKIIHNWRGSPHDSGWPQTFVADVQIASGWGHSGYPWMGTLPWSDSFTNWEGIRKGDYWGFVHEFGHNLQVGAATFEGGGEVTNNVYSIPCTQHLLGYENTKIGSGLFNPGRMGHSLKTWKSDKYRSVDFGYYVYVNYLFGEGFIGNLWTKAGQANPRSMADKKSFWIREGCIESGYNLVPFHKLYNFDIDPEVAKVCGTKPCIMPNDNFTAQVPEKIDKILKEYEDEFGKQCERGIPKKTALKRNILDGVGKTLPPRAEFS